MQSSLFSQELLSTFDGRLSPDIYSTAWVALVPHAKNPDNPAWPQALEFLRRSQLSDGGWGEPSVLYAHERTLATLAVVRALDVWNSEQQGDSIRIRGGLQALRQYAPLLARERHEPIGFELLLPRLRRDLNPAYHSELPIADWSDIEVLNRDKLALIKTLHPHREHIGSWWFSMEMLPEEKLASLDDSILESNGSIAASPAATAAYLWARRRAGYDSPAAAAYLDNLIQWSKGSVPFCYPAEIFERLWVLDNLRRAGIKSNSAWTQLLLKSILNSWERNTPGISFSEQFAVNDGDSTSVALTVLEWGGLSVDDAPLLAFWDGDHIRSYIDERGASVSANVHALAAFRAQPGLPRRSYAEKLTDWLLSQMVSTDTLFEDKWHYSPFYTVSRAVPAFLGWHDEGSQRAIRFILEHQNTDGGWGWYGARSTLEETALCVLAIVPAYECGAIDQIAPLIRAAEFMGQWQEQEQQQALWIGKTLYRSDAIVQGTAYAAWAALSRLTAITRHSQLVSAMRHRSEYEEVLTLSTKLAS